MKYEALLIAFCATCSASFSIQQHVITTLAFCTVGTPAYGFFGGFFRRRSRPALSPAIVSDVEESSSMPSGPVLFPFRPRQPIVNSPFFTFGSRERLPPASQFFQGQRPQQQTVPSDLFTGRQQIPMSQFQFPQNSQFPQEFQQWSPQDFQNAGFESVPGRSVDETPTMNPEDAESFFALLSETDESKCISRLVCEMGADPMNGGEFGATIAEIISNLQEFPQDSKASYYNEILQTGMVGGPSECARLFTECDNEMLQMVKEAQNSEAQS